jgi:hypothetical protein
MSNDKKMQTKEEVKKIGMTTIRVSYIVRDIEINTRGKLRDGYN